MGGWLRFTNNGYEIARMGYYAGSNGGGGYILVTDDYGRERVTMEGEPGCLAVHDTSGNITTRIYTHQYATYFLDLAYHIASHMGNDTTRSYMTLNSPAGTTDIFLDTLNGCRIGTSFTVTGTKSRAADAGEYGERLLYCYETPTPMFGDVGEGVLDETGTAYIVLDPVLAETVNSAGYQVFLQKYGAGDIYVAERKGPYFVVNGTPGLAFGWELKAKQKDFDQLRLEQYVEPENEEEPDYGGMAAEYIQELYNGRITE